MRKKIMAIGAGAIASAIPNAIPGSIPGATSGVTPGVTPGAIRSAIFGAILTALPLAGGAQGFATPATQGFAASATQGFAAPATQGFAASATQGFAAPATQGFATPATQGFAASATQGFAAPATQGFAASATQGFAASATQGERPRLVVSVTLSGVPHEALQKFADKFSVEGFSRFAAAGTVYRAARTGYMQTLAPAGIATLTTGVDPSVHGVAASAWMDYVTGSRVSLIGDDAVQGVGGDAGAERYSPRHVVMPTVGDRLLAESPGSRVVSVAADPVSAIVAGGRKGRAYWMDGQRAVWVSSSAYMTALPDWIAAYNAAHTAQGYAEAGWTPARPVRGYLNTANTIFGGQGGGERVTSFSRGSVIDYAAMLASPIGATLVADFARRAVAGEELGRDDATDMLYVTLDAPRRVGERFGAGSMEYEDMLYRLDMDLGGMMSTIENEVGLGRVLFVLASDGGIGDPSETAERFNVAQFRTILNSFLGVQFGAGEWVIDYIDRQVYLNRNLIYSRNMNLEDVQNRAAAFALQFRGVSHVLTSTALSGGYFASGYGAAMQRGFYPRRAGDLMINLMPGWIEERPGVVALSGSMYDYDTHVPLALTGWRVAAGRTVDTPVDVTALAPTLARIMGVGRPAGSDGATLPGLDAVIER